MNINTITAEDLRRMPDKEGLILQGCGGDLTEWVDGINEMLTKAGILKDGCQFENVAAFQHGELTCLLYPFDDVKLDIGKLALWRLQTHEVYGGTWLSDFVPNYLGGFIETPEALADKPDCPLIGADGNIFNLLGIASRTLREHGLKEQAKEKPLNPAEIWEQRQMTELIYKGLSKLPVKQRQRIYAHFFLGMSKADIAKAEGTHKSRITRSIEAGLRSLEKYFKEIL